ncbi:DUF4084 domain-containing protein [Virgibacillus flavescens]|uniref:DUF4084 domain-containing protein n=1 Tax=Virgibacillus flavescens TaxID=1611422 RepID=UPI003D333C40
MNFVNARAFPAILFIIIYIILFYFWLISFGNDIKLLTIGFLFFSIVGGGVSFSWLMKSFRIIKTKQRYFWMWMGLGVLFYTLTNITWFFDQNLPNVTNLFILSSDYLWYISFLLFAIAYVYQAKSVISNLSIIPVIFNIVIFINVAISINLYYILGPLINHAAVSEDVTFMTLAYPIYNLGFLFAAISIYFFLKGFNRKYVSYIIAALIIQTIADFFYTYLVIFEKYQAGLVDPIWQAVILLFGLSSIVDRKKNVTSHSEAQKHVYRSQNSSLPYVSVLVLLVLVIINFANELNALIIGLSISFLLIIARQVFIMKTNTNLIKKYRELAHFDTLTGLYNRWKFEEDLEVIIKKAKREDNTVTLFLMDLNRFKYINDTLGHSYGDRVLIEFGSRLKKVTEIGGTLYRVGGDEFAIVFSEQSCPECMRMLKELVKNLDKPIYIEEHEISIDPSIGVSLYPDNGDTIGDLIDKADAAMYFAKEKGKKDFQFYNDEINSQIARKRLLESSLINARANNELELYYQPQKDIQTEKLIGMEALIRWNHPNLGLIPPGEFITLAEKTGQIVSIGEWVLETACRQNKLWQDAGHQYLCVSVNVSAIQFRDIKFLDFVKKTLEKTGLHPSYLELEITESVMQDAEESMTILSKLKKIGVSVSIDDFGTGYSSLYMLRQLPIDTIKIDKSFIDDIVDPDNQSIVETIINIGDNLRLKVIAEGIESMDQLDVLKKQGCSLGQGYLFSKPVPVKEFDSILQAEIDSLYTMV